MIKGVIYILTNPSFPEYVKIGYADDIAKRLKELNRSECIPYAFRAYATYSVEERLSDVEIQKNGLKVFLNLEKGGLKDPDGVAEDVSNLGHWGNGDYRIYLADDEKFAYVLGLLKQSFDAQQGVK